MGTHWKVTKGVVLDAGGGGARGGGAGVEATSSKCGRTLSKIGGVQLRG